MNNHFAKVGAWLCVVGLLLLALALTGCNSQPDCAATAKQARAEGKTCFVADGVRYDMQ